MLCVNNVLHYLSNFYKILYPIIKNQRAPTKIFLSKRDVCHVVIYLNANNRWIFVVILCNKALTSVPVEYLCCQNYFNRPYNISNRGSSTQV